MGVRHGNSPPEWRPGEESETVFFRLTLHSDLPEDRAGSVTNSRVLPGYRWLGQAVLLRCFSSSGEHARRHQHHRSQYSRW